MKKSAVRYWWWRLTDPIVCWSYRWLYCPRYGHQVKMQSYGVCINCGRKT